MSVPVGYQVITHKRNTQYLWMKLNSEWKKIKKKLCVTEQERDRIATETKRQSSCTEWFTHRRVRITASKC